MVVAMSWMLLHDSRGEMLDIAQIDNQHVRRLANALRQFDGEASGPGQNAGGVEDAHQALVAAVRMGAFADELLRKLRGGKSLGPHEPHGWGAIPRQLCEAAKLPTGRCVSLACLRAQGDDVTTLARECGITPQTLAVSGEPAQPADATAWRAWLMEIPREELPQDIADALSNGNLPVNQTVVAAKGVLHAIWPALVRRAADFPNLAAAELPALVTGVVADEARRSARAAQIVAVAALAAELPASAKAFLERQVPGSEAAFSKLSASAGALKPLFDDPQNLIRLPDDSDAPAMAGAEAIEKLRAAIVDIVPQLPEIASERVVEYIADQVNQAIANRSPYRVEGRLGLPDGTIRWVQSLGEVICDESDTPVRISGSLLDIHERKEAERALRESEARFTAFLDHKGVDKSALLGYSLGGRIALGLLEAMPGRLSRVFLAAPDGLITKPWYRGLAASKAGRALYRRFVESPQLVHALVHGARSLRLIPEKMHRFLIGQTDSKHKRMLVRDVWLSFRNIEPDLKVVAEQARMNGISVHLFFGTHDSVIKPALGEHLRQFAPELITKEELPFGHVLLTQELGEAIVARLKGEGERAGV